MDTPDKIYLLDLGDEITWCDVPAPGNDMQPDDAIAYVKASKLEALAKGWKEESVLMEDCANKDVTDQIDKCADELNELIKENGE